MEYQILTIVIDFCERTIKCPTNSNELKLALQNAIDAIKELRKFY